MHTCIERWSYNIESFLHPVSPSSLGIQMRQWSFFYEPDVDNWHYSLTIHSKAATYSFTAMVNYIQWWKLFNLCSDRMLSVISQYMRSLEFLPGLLLYYSHCSQQRCCVRQTMPLIDFHYEWNILLIRSCCDKIAYILKRRRHFVMHLMQ